jgi:hypothetical protein
MLKGLVIGWMKANQGKVTNMLLLEATKRKIPMSGEVIENDINVLYDMTESVVVAIIDEQINNKKEQ